MRQPYILKLFICQLQAWFTIASINIEHHTLRFDCANQVSHPYFLLSIVTAAATKHSNFFLNKKMFHGSMKSNKFCKIVEKNQNFFFFKSNLLPEVWELEKLPTTVTSNKRERFSQGFVRNYVKEVHTTLKREIFKLNLNICLTSLFDDS